MARIDLNIIDRGTKGTNWIADDVCLTAEHLDEVMEQKTDNSGALNSLPTPFARFFVAREAFRRVLEERRTPKQSAGFAYRQIVSDILDLYELLFNFTYHKNTWTRGQKIELREWDAEEDMKRLKEKMPVLFKSIHEYYNTDIRESKLHFVIYSEKGKDILLGCTSPITGFITPPDMDKEIIKEVSPTTPVPAGVQYRDLRIHRKSGGEYFRDIRMFDEREEDFKNYMYNEIFSSDQIDLRFNSIKEYIRSFKNDPDIRNDYRQSLTSVKTDQNKDLIINGLKIMSSDEIDVNNLFTPTLIKLPYRLSRENFKTLPYKNDSKDRDYDYLLPFKPEVLSLFPQGEIDGEIELNRRDSVTVSLRYNGKTYKKTYSKDPLNQAMGLIQDYKADSISFDMGIFPNILSSQPEENNYFKIIVIGADEDPAPPYFNIDEIELRFFKEARLVEEMDPLYTNAKFGVRPAVVRSRQKDDSNESGTKYYEVFNTDFDVIEVNILGNTGLLMPLFKKAITSKDTYTYAIDLGTSNTFISRCKVGENTMPEMFRMNSPMVSYMHEYDHKPQMPLAHSIEDSIFNRAKSRIRTEFIPPLIDGEEYRFPIRTAICGLIREKDEPELFDTHNIAFFYEKSLHEDDQRISTDIKWAEKDGLLRIFIRELLLMIKSDVLQRNGDPKHTKIIWFRPLSFTGTLRERYKDIWESEAERILGIPKSQISCFSESEAPYYFFKKKDYVKDSEAVAVIDIGGGSTDFVYFQDNQPVMANSVHFGCDVLWENGFNEFDNERKNGIFIKYADSLRFKRPDLEDLNTAFKMTDTSKTKDIINFWISNSEYCDIRNYLSRDFKYLFVYHLTSILFYMASMYKEYGYIAPRSIIFSGNGSKYIDGYITSDKRIIKKIVDLAFNKVFGGSHDIKIELPSERKEATCYGGLYRDANASDVPHRVFQGEDDTEYNTIGELSSAIGNLSLSLRKKYDNMNQLYQEVMRLLSVEGILDNTTNIANCMKVVSQDMTVPMKTYYRSMVQEKYNKEAPVTDSVFFLPIINRVFELTKLDDK